MAYYQNNEFEYMADVFFDMAEFEDDNPFEDNPRCECEYGDDDVAKPKTDTSALEFRNGKDIQGIPWERLNFTRDMYRETRLKQYKNYENLQHSRAELEKECTQVDTNSTFYNFKFNTRVVHSTIAHFQERTAI